MHSRTFRTRTLTTLGVISVAALAAACGDDDGDDNPDQVQPRTLADVTLSVQAGTQIYASAGGATSLVITRGSQINAVGTAAMPIIMAAAETNSDGSVPAATDLTNLATRGDWGGLILSGLGITNLGNENGESDSEASPPNAPRFYGGNDNSDSSGTVRYAIVAETGFPFDSDKEVQGVTIEAAGSGTELDYIQVIGSDDDCVEWFGGAASMSHLVCTGVGDDGLDIDEGYVGEIQFAIVSMGSENGDHGIEADNNKNAPELAPITSPIVANVTVLGRGGLTDDDELSHAMEYKEGYSGRHFRSAFVDAFDGQFDRGCMFIQDPAIIPDLSLPSTIPDGLEHNDIVFSCAGGDLVATSNNLATQAFLDEIPGFVNSQSETVTLDPQTLAVSVSGDGPQVAFPAGSSLEATDFYGAVDPSVSQTEAWWYSWTARDSSGVLVKDAETRFDGDLPGGDFHPLQQEIFDGTLIASATNECAALGFADGGTATVFGEDFPVCVINGDILEDVTLPNNHIFILNTTVNVGDGQTSIVN